MADLKISAATAGNMENNVANVTIESKQLEGAGSQEETEYINPNWSSQLGIYKTIPEFKIAIDMRAIWTIGNEIEASPEVKAILDHISGWGKDTFRGVLKNLLKTRRIGQDSFAEIIRADDGTLLNLKPLDPSYIKVIYGNDGRLKRYEQISRFKGTENKKFQPEEVFHLSNCRIGDEIHGIADSDCLKSIMEAKKESFEDMRKLMHRYVKPIFKFMLDTDDEAKINLFIAKMEKVVDKGENIYVPLKAVEQELISVPANSTLNPLPWQENLKNYFYQVVGMPQIIMGSSGEFTESTAKIAYLAFEQSVKDEQADIIEQVWDQLALRIKLKFPASLQNELLSDESKDMSSNGMPQGADFQAGDTTAGVGK